LGEAEMSSISEGMEYLCVYSRVAVALHEFLLPGGGAVAKEMAWS
jgi:hypothetical protein